MRWMRSSLPSFFDSRATSGIYTLSLHDALPIFIVSIFIPKLRLILILNSFLGSSDSLVFSELFHSLAPRPLAAKEWNKIGRAVQQECRDRSRMPSSA